MPDVIEYYFRWKHTPDFNSGKRERFWHTSAGRGDLSREQRALKRRSAKSTHSAPEKKPRGRKKAAQKAKPVPVKVQPIIVLESGSEEDSHSSSGAVDVIAARPNWDSEDEERFPIAYCPPEPLDEGSN